MSEFQREDRYIVIKRSDLERLRGGQTEGIRQQLAKVSPLLPKRQCAVIESDWPEYEVVWQMIEKRVKESQPLTQRYSLSMCGISGARDVNGQYVTYVDFCGERAARLAAERQVGELREQVAADAAGFWGRMAGKEHIANQKLQAKLDTAMGLLRGVCQYADGLKDSEFGAWAYAGSTASWKDHSDEHYLAAMKLLNTTSTEGKDHE